MFVRIAIHRFARFVSVVSIKRQLLHCFFAFLAGCDMISCDLARVNFRLNVLFVGGPTGNHTMIVRKGRHHEKARRLYTDLKQRATIITMRTM